MVTLTIYYINKSNLISLIMHQSVLIMHQRPSLIIHNLGVAKIELKINTGNYIPPGNIRLPGLHLYLFLEIGLCGVPQGSISGPRTSRQCSVAKGKVCGNTMRMRNVMNTLCIDVIYEKGLTRMIIGPVTPSHVIWQSPS